MTPLRAIGWEFWRRHRIGFSAIGLYFLILAAFKTVMLARGQTVVFDSPLTFALIDMLPISITSMYFLAIFTYGLDGDIAARQSMYPSRKFTLPASDAALAGGPMLYAIGAMMLLWAALRTFVMWPSEFSIPYVWPATLAAALVAWTQAMVWMPYGFTGARILTSMLVLAVIETVVMIALQLKAPEWVVLAITVPLVPLAYVTAKYAVGRARQGIVPEWGLSALGSRLAVRSHAKSRKPRAESRFRSAHHAQFWFEWRRYGLSLPVAVALVVPLELLMLLAADSEGLVFVVVFAALLTPPFMAAFVAATVGREAGGTRDAYGLSPFLATRPVTSASLIAAKLRMTLWSTALTWLLMLVAIPLAVHWTHRTAFVTGRWDKSVAFMGQTRTIVFAAVLVCAFIIGTWRQLVSTMYVGLTGREWIIKGYLALTLVALSVIGPILDWIVRDRQVEFAIWNGTPLILGVLATVKVALAIWVTMRLFRSGLLREQTIVRSAALWCALVLSLHALFLWFLGTSMFPHYLSAFLAILAVPVVRIAASPLTLAWNRHR